MSYNRRMTLITRLKPALGQRVGPSVKDPGNVVTTMRSCECNMSTPKLLLLTLFPVLRDHWHGDTNCSADRDIKTPLQRVSEVLLLSTLNILEWTYCSLFLSFFSFLDIECGTPIL